MEDSKKQTILEIFENAKSILIVYSENSNYDKLAFTTSLFDALKASYSDKDVELLCSSNQLVEQFPELTTLANTKSQLGKKNLCIGFDYIKDSVDKVSYYIDESQNKFYLTIQPKKGVKPLDSEKISFFYNGAEADLIFLVGIDSLDSLNQLYYGYESLYQSAAVISINNYETDFANFNFDISGNSCFSEYALNIFNDLNLKIDSDSATNLLKAITNETNNFESFLATADTFEVVANLLRLGARRSTPNKKQLFSSEDFFESSDSENAIALVEDKTDFKITNFAEALAKKNNGSAKKNKSKSKTKKSAKTDEKAGALDYNPSGFSPKGG